jgi:hypothetical protein
MISGGDYTDSYDGDCFHGILSCMRGYELLRGDSDYKSIIRNTSGRARHCRVCLRGIFSRESNIK